MLVTPAAPANAGADAAGLNVYDSGIYVDDRTTPIHWLDDETAFFSGYKQPKPRSTREQRQLEAVLYLWRPGERPQPYAEGLWSIDQNRQYCAADGIIRYAIAPLKDSDTSALQFRHMVGPPGAEREVIVEPFAQPGVPVLERAVPTNTRTVSRCRLYSDPKMKGRRWAVSHDGAHYLDFGPAGSWDRSHDPVILLAADGSHVADLPIGRDEAEPICVKHHQFSDEFLI